MLKAKDIMSKEVVSVSPDMEVTAVARLLLERHFNGVPVVDESGKLLGIICQSDLVAEQKKLPIPSFFTLLDTFIPLFSQTEREKDLQKIAAVKARQAMTQDPLTVGPETILEEIASIMVNKHCHTIPVVRDGKLVGIIGKEDVLRTLLSQSQ
ncbi:MAG: CBS domain-containing protein [Desulfobacteraceae bacterium]|nr:CBS domain-containing protein [Desulfobacteraceae bacterium]